MTPKKNTTSRSRARPTPPEPRKRGRPEKKPDPSIVEGLARLGCINDEIATLLDVDEKTLVKHCSDALKKGRAGRKVSLRRTLDGWVSKNVAAMIFVAKNDLGMSDQLKHEVTGADGGPLQQESVVYIVEMPANGRDKLGQGDGEDGGTDA